MNTNKGFLSLLGCGFILAIFALLVRLLNNYIGPLTQVGIRMLIASLIVLPYFLIKKIPLKIKDVKFLPFSILILSFPLYIIFFTISVINAKVANAFFYLFTTSLLTSYLLGFLYFKETINKKRLFLALLSIVGLILITYPLSANKGYLGIISGVIGGGFWGISNATRKFFTGKINHWLIILYQMIVGAIISLLLAYFLKEFNIAKWSVQSISLLSFFGVGLVIIQILLFIGFANFKLNLGSVVLASQLVFVQAIGIFILHEIPTTTEILGSLAIIIAIIISNIDFELSFPRFAGRSLDEDW
jgi:chloramphenicol-sensitive protein RarD